MSQAMTSSATIHSALQKNHDFQELEKQREQDAGPYNSQQPVIMCDTQTQGL